MATQKHLGKGKLVKRLSAQVGDEGLARALLQKRGDMSPSGKLTAKGRKRDGMTAAERAKDRAAKDSGKPKSAYSYDPKTNQATLKRGKN